MDPNAFMMGGGMQMQQQRPQPLNDHNPNELLARIVQELSKNPIQTGWQAGLDLRTRAACILNLVKALRVLNNQENVNGAVNIAMRFERQIITNTPSEEEWMAGIKSKLGEISVAHQAHREKIRILQQQQQQQQAMAMQMQPSRSQQGEMAPQVPMAPQMMGQMNMQPQMQQQQPQLQQQQQQMQQGQQQQQMQQQQQQGQGFSAEEQKQISNLARNMINQVPEDQRNMMRQRLMSAIPPQQREHYQRQGVDPVVKHFQSIAIKKFVQEKQRRAQQAGGPIDFSSFAGQQADAMKMADQGQLVVPASNNNMGMDPAPANMANMGQMNMQPALQNNQQQIQNMMAQRQQQTHAQMRNNQMQQQAHAQAQARNAAQQQAQQQMLRGQPGGLNTTQPPQQSPAMSMLNRPMAPPGQPAQTPSQPRAQAAPQLNQQMNPQMMAQFSQQIANNPNPFPTSKPDLQLPANMQFPPGVREKIQGMPPEKQLEIIQKIRNTQQQQQQSANQVHAAQQMMMNNMTPGVPMTQQGLQTGAMGMPPQAPPNPQQQMAMGMSGATNHQQVQQRLMMQRQREMDAKDFPPKLMNDTCAVPPNVKTWGQLKEFVQQNQQSLPPGVMDKVRKMQLFVIQKQQEVAANNANGMPGIQMPGQTPTAPGPNQAPPAQMVPQAPQMGANPGMPNMNQHPQNTYNLDNMPLPAVTDQELQVFKARYTNTQGWSTEQLRVTVGKMKLQSQLAKQQQQQQQQQQNPAMVQQQQQMIAMRQAQMQQQSGAPGMPAQNPMAPTVPQMGPQSAPMQPQRSQQQMAMMQQQQQQNMSTNQKGQKRPGANDDVVEIPNPNQSPQRPAAVNGQQQKNQKPTMQLDPEQLKNMHPDKIKNMPPEQRAVMQQSMQQLQQKMQMEALKRAQSSTSQPQKVVDGQQQGEQAQQVPSVPQTQQAKIQGGPSSAQASNMKVQQQRARLAAITQETQANYRKGPPQEVTEASLNEVVTKLRGCRDMIVKLDKMLPTAMTFVNDRIVHTICLERAKLLGEMSLDGSINSYISLSTQQISEAEGRIRAFIMQCLTHIQKLKTTSSPEQLQQNVDPTKPPQAPTAATAAMAQAGSKGGDRSKPPPAPTSAVPPPFPASHASPHGLPVYDGSFQGLTPDKLQLPANKRRKTGQPGSSASTPANAGTTPGSMPSPNIKMQSPDDKRRQVQPKVEPPRGPEKKYKCADEYCEFYVIGFEKEEELQMHTAEAHKGIENPLDYLLENAAAAFELDVYGNERAMQNDNNALPVTAKLSTLGPNTVKRETLKVDGQTPGKNIKAGTPSPFIKPGTPPTIARTPQGLKRATRDHEPAASSPKEKTMLDTMMEKAGVTMPPTEKRAVRDENRRQSSTPPNMWSSNDADDNFMRSVRETLNGLDEVAQYPDMDWTMDPSPDMTPSSSNSGTSAATSNFTDISEHDRVKIMFESDPFGLGSGIQFDLSDDLGMGFMGIQSTFDNKKDDQNKATPPPDCSWDAMFGANAGMDRNDTNWDKDPMGNSIFEGVTFFDI
ncbi:hypothetical protein E4T43_04510 [Aureobasidium subglaciale]|nr:hypothetical protein E4T43_04510 [Aureobasidium subglaciale]